MGYTHINNDQEFVTKYNGMQVTQATINHRNQLRHGMDSFTGFTWRGVDAWDNFGAFIVNNKNSLKFYNGATWSNNYTKSQFESSSTQLTGLTFSTQKIDFTIGVYWFNEEQYRQLIYWLNPYEINTLTFDFEPRYYYQVKLASVAEGTRYVIGKETRQGKVIYEYYTEMKLSFEVQGPNCAYAKIPYQFDNINIDDGIVHQFNSTDDNKPSDLSYPINVLFNFNLDKIAKDIKSSNSILNLNFEVSYKGTKYTLISLGLKNLPYGERNEETYQLSIRYDSEAGILFLDMGDSRYFLLNTLTTLSSGKKIVDYLSVKKYSNPGIFEDYTFDQNQVFFETKAYLTANNTSDNSIILSSSNDYYNVSINARARTNLI